MKTVRRLTVQIERRRVEWSVYVQESPRATAGEYPAEPCPHCGSPWMLLKHTTLHGLEYAPEDLRASLAPLGLHFRSAPSGQLWICRNSFEQLKENI